MVDKGFIVGELNIPHRVAVSDDDGGFIIVTEYMGNCLTVLDKEGKKVKSFGGEGKFSGPRGVAINPDNFILVTDDDHRIQKISMDGECIASVGKEGNGPHQFKHPDGIAISPITGHIFIADWGNNRVQVLNPDLTFSHSFGQKGSAEGQFKEPSDIAFDSKGMLYVTDRDNHRIQVFTPEGQFVAQFGAMGSGPGQLGHPMGITLNRSTNLVYVAEEGNNRVSIFSCEGQFLSKFEKDSSECKFDRPRGITINIKNVLYVCDTWNNRLVVH